MDTKTPDFYRLDNQWNQIIAKFKDAGYKGAQRDEIERGSREIQR